MTLPASAEKIGGRLPSAKERSSANQLRELLAAHVAGDAKLKIVRENKPVDVVLTRGLSDLLMEVLRHVGRGDAVTLVPVSQKLTTQQAADILNVSRPHLISLLDNKVMPYSKVGRHRRIKANDLFEYKARRDEERSGALSTLAQIDAELI